MKHTGIQEHTLVPVHQERNHRGQPVFGGENNEFGKYKEKQKDNCVMGVYQPHTGPEGSDQSLWVQEIISPRPCCTCSRRKGQIKGGCPAKSGLAEKEEGFMLQAPCDSPRSGNHGSRLCTDNQLTVETD